MVTSSYCSISRSNCRNDDDELTTVWNFQDSHIIVIARVFHFLRPFLAPRLAGCISKLATLIFIVGQICRLDVPVHEFGESFYNEKIPPVIQELSQRPPMLGSVRGGEKHSCGTASLNQVNYRGTTNVTVNGRTCQRWDEQFPHSHDRTNETYPGLEGNYSFAWCVVPLLLKTFHFERIFSDFFLVVLFPQKLLRNR
jgi:hypothetical protein